MQLPVPSDRGRRRGKRTRAQRPFPGNNQLEPVTGLPIPGVQHQEGESLQVVSKPVGLTGSKKPRLHSRRVSRCLLTPEIGQREQVSGLFPTTTPAHTLDELSGHSGLGSSCGTAPHYNKGCLSQRKCTVAGDRCGLDLGQHPNRSGAIVAGACKGGGLGTVWNSDW